ncbi:MAG TPA: hypothetical protein VIK61_02550 [Acidimicrobiia bacterium]
MISGTVHEIVSRSEFHLGAKWGFALAALTALAGLLSLWVFHRPVPIAGLIVPIAFASAARHWQGGLPGNVTHGLLLLAFAGLAAGALGSWWRPLAWVGIVLAIPGASLLTSNTGLPDVSWVGPLVVVTTVVGGTLVADFDRRHAKRGWPVVMLAVSVVGVYFTVPDTERALVLLGASVPLVLLGWPFAFASIGTIGAYPAVGALAWTAAFEGRGRHTAIVAGVACLGLFVAEPIARLLNGGRSTVLELLPKRWWIAIPVVIGHLGLVYVASRIAGLRTDVGQATVISLGELAMGVAVLVALQVDVLRAHPDARRADQ